MRTCGGKIYGCVEHTLSAIQRHAEVTETHITVPNSQEWREALIAISPGKAAFVFMNEKTANMDTVTGDINNYRISRKEIAETAIKRYMRDTVRVAISRNKSKSIRAYTIN